VAPTVPPDVFIVVYADHVPSGTGVLPVLAAIAMLVAGGVSLFQVTVPQAFEEPASKTREVKVPDNA
jgi:hypothetical protein